MNRPKFDISISFTPEDSKTIQKSVGPLSGKLDLPKLTQDLRNAFTSWENSGDKHTIDIMKWFQCLCDTCNLVAVLPTPEKGYEFLFVVKEGENLQIPSELVHFEDLHTDPIFPVSPLTGAPHTPGVHL